MKVRNLIIVPALTASAVLGVSHTAPAASASVPAGIPHAVKALGQESASHHQASHQGRDPVMCFYYDVTQCMHSNGVGAQITMTECAQAHSCGADWTERYTANGYLMLQTTSGDNCMRARSDNGVYVNSGACDSSDRSEVWSTCITSCSNFYRLVNQGQGGVLNGYINGKVWSGACQSNGDYCVWAFYPASAKTTTAHTTAHLTADRTVAGSTTGVSPKTGLACTSYWRWHVVFGVNQHDAYSSVWWTQNSCGYIIQDRSHCEAFGGSKYDTYSGKVVGTYTYDRAYCHNWVDQIHQGAKRYETSAGWGSYRAYWNG